MLGDLFDSPWKLLIVAAVLIILFGSRKLPDAARSLGRSMRILKSEVQDLHGDHDHETAETPRPDPVLPSQQQQIDQLQQQIRHLQQQPAGQPVTVDGHWVADAPPTHQHS
jgi:sec-independent protein translocase protein TatA